MKRHDAALVWFRRDLRAHDHAALYHALREARAVHCAFCFDREILDPLPRADRRVEFIWHSVAELAAALAALGGGLTVLHGRADREIPALAARLGVDAVYASQDYEPAALARDARVAAALKADGRALVQHKDQVIFDRDEVLTGEGRPYSVFTPYKRAWLARLEGYYLKPYPAERHAGALAAAAAAPLPTLADLGFQSTDLLKVGVQPGMAGARALLDDFAPRLSAYRERRDYPALKGPSYLSAHLRFGTLSIREAAALAWRGMGPGAETWLSELCWRDFYAMILWHHPRLAEGRAFKEAFDGIRFPGGEDLYAAWCQGRSGYPLVDAAMRQLSASGYMHNRLRMVAASFLVKDLLVDWRRGEAWFAEKLLDFDLASNNGGWQWAASTGCDAQPWFRIFNPVTQSRRFDPEGRFIRRYVPELAALPDKWLHEPWRMPPVEAQALGFVLGRDYPAPVVDHAVQRERALALYGAKRER